MRTIKIVIDEDTFQEIRNNAQVRAMSGNMYGLLDAFIVGFLKRVEQGEEEWTVKRRNTDEKTN